MFDVEAFIEAVKERPALYDALHKNYNRKDVRTRLWDDIGRKMYPEWGNLDVRDKNEKVTTMQKKWKSLKDCFNREIRLQKSRDPKKLRKKYEFYDKLCFLLRNQPPTAAASAATAATVPPEPKIKTEEDPEYTISPLEVVTRGAATATTVGAVPLSRKRRRREEEVPSGRGKLQRADNSDDSDRLFLMSFVSDLKRLPFATKYWVRMMFSQIMHKAARRVDEYQDGDFEQEDAANGEEYLDDFSDDGSNSSLHRVYYL